MSGLSTKSLYLIVAIAAAGLFLGGCSKKSAVATASITEPSREASRPTAPAAENKSLQGFAKAPADEVIKAPALVASAKPDSTPAAGQGLAEIYFGFDRWAITKEGKTDLVQDAEFLKQRPSAKVLIEGYCDERGSRELGSSRVDLQACKLEYSIVSPK